MVSSIRLVQVMVLHFQKKVRCTSIKQKLNRFELKTPAPLRHCPHNVALFDRKVVHLHPNSTATMLIVAFLCHLFLHFILCHYFVVSHCHGGDVEMDDVEDMSRSKRVQNPPRLDPETVKANQKKARENAKMNHKAAGGDSSFFDCTHMLFKLDDGSTCDSTTKGRIADSWVHRFHNAIGFCNNDDETSSNTMAAEARAHFKRHKVGENKSQNQTVERWARVERFFMANFSNGYGGWLLSLDIECTTSTGPITFKVRFAHFYFTCVQR